MEASTQSHAAAQASKAAAARRTQKICVDGLFLGGHFAGAGINRYLVALLREMERLTSADASVRWRVLVPPAAAAGGPGASPRPGFELAACRAMQLTKIWRAGLLLWTTEARAADVVFLPTPIPIYARRKPLAVVVHDIIPLRFPDEFRTLAGRVLRQSCLSCLRRADLVLTDSEFSRNDILSVCEAPPERVVVAHLGIDADAFQLRSPDPVEEQEVLRRRGIRQPYVLHVGRLETRKNLPRLIRAFRLLADRRKDWPVQLVLCGTPSLGFHEIQRLLDQPGMAKNVVLTGLVSDSDLHAIYRAATCFALPSLYEGFGLPLLEAMACGVPAISSRSSSLPEVGGQAPRYFDPESVEEMAAAMEEVLSDSALRERMVARGLERSRCFSWSECARKTLDALRSL